MKTIKGLCLDLAERLELPPDAFAGAVRMTALDDRRLLIENHRGVLEYGEALIRVDGGKGEIVLRGEGLRMSAMNREELLIAGRLQSLEWT